MTFRDTVIFTFLSFSESCASENIACISYNMLVSEWEIECACVILTAITELEDCLRSQAVI